MLCDNENHSIKEEQNYTSEFVNKIAPNFKEDVEEIDTEDGSVTPYVPTNDNINKAYKQGASIVSENCRVGLGGDKIKDFNYTYEVRPDVIAGVTSKDYILPFNINNRKSEIVSHPNKINTTFINVVTDNTEKTIYDNNYKNSKKSLFIPIVACYLFWFVSILICSIMVTGFSFDVLELNLAIAFFVSIIPSIAFVIIWTGIHKKVWENRTENQTELALYERDVKKYNTLQAKLKELGFNPLSQEEKDRFKHLEIKSKKQNKFLSLMERFILWLEKLSFKKKKQEKGISEC